MKKIVKQDPPDMFLSWRDTGVAAKETISRLGLDIDQLVAFRRNAIEGYPEILDTMSDDEILLLTSKLGERDKQGAFVPFCFAVVQILRGLIRRLQDDSAADGHE